MKAVLIALTVLATAYGLTVGSGWTQEATVATDAFPKLRARIDANADASRLYRACPGDQFRSLGSHEAPGSITVEGAIELCGANPEFCLSKCLDAQQGHACLNTALLLQDKAGGEDHRYWETLFAMACAMGEPSGCTNRAAGIRNGGYAGDPFPNPHDSATQQCLFSSFDRACAAGDEWGCTMVGQAHLNGEGTAKHRSKAEASFDKACAEDSESEACSYAAELLATADPE